MKKLEMKFVEETYDEESDEYIYTYSISSKTENYLIEKFGPDYSEVLNAMFNEELKKLVEEHDNEQ